MNPHLRQRAPRERGYILLTLMLFITLLTIGLLAVAQNIESQIKRDREEELIHRGVQYSRAVRLFYVKFRRFPASVEELESTNNIRFLRKRYKDPITGKDFKPLYMNEVGVFQGPASPAGASPPALAEQPAGSDDGTKRGETTPDPEADPSDVAEAKAAAAEAAAAANAPATPDPQSSEAAGAPALVGVPIVGVVSLSHHESIRVFNKKDHYNQWLFIFNPSYSTGLINTPDQPPLKQAAHVSADAGPNQVPDSNQGPSNAAPVPNASHSHQR